MLKLADSSWRNTVPPVLPIVALSKGKSGRGNTPAAAKEADKPPAKEPIDVTASKGPVTVACEGKECTFANVASYREEGRREGKALESLHRYRTILARVFTAQALAQRERDLVSHQNILHFFWTKSAIDSFCLSLVDRSRSVNLTSKNSSPRPSYTWSMLPA